MDNVQMRLIKKVISRPVKALTVLGRSGVLNWMSDEAYIRLLYRAEFREKLDLDHPETFNQKMQWLKLYDRNPVYPEMVDKYKAKSYVSDRIGSEYIIPAFGVWDSFDEIDFDRLPNQFVLKCTHDSGGVLICRDKNRFDIAQARKKMNYFLKHDYYHFGREWPYKNIHPRILAEQYMEDEAAGELRDYKFLCFGGKVKCFKIDFDRFSGHHANYYDPDGRLLDIGIVNNPPVFDRELHMPTDIEKMKEIAEKLTEGLPFCRADLYEVNGRIYFGELTFYPASGFAKYTTRDADMELGSWIPLPDKDRWTDGRRT